MRKDIQDTCVIYARGIVVDVAQGQALPGQKDVDAWVAVWRQRLQIPKGWTITARVVHADKMSPDVIAHTEASRLSRQADILFLDADDMAHIYHLGPSCIWAEMQDAVVHELVHVSLEDIVFLGGNDVYKERAEMIVQRLTKAIDGFDRGPCWNRETTK